MTRIFAGCALFYLGCAAPVEHPPTARIALSPIYVALGDDYRTDVLLDATGSTDEIADPGGKQPLYFAWVVDDVKAQVLPDAAEGKATVRVAGTHPVTVHLTVSNQADVKDSVTAQIGVSVPSP